MRVLILLGAILFCTNVQASYYIVDNENRVVGKADYIPDATDLESRKEVAIYSDLQLDISNAEYRAGKLVEKVIGEDEKEDNRKRESRDKEMKKIENRALKMAYEALKAEGVNFKEIDETDLGGQ